jgi:hypothetical protein
MESHMGVRDKKKDLMSTFGELAETTAADLSAEAASSRANAKVTRVYWELVDEGKEPIVPKQLEAKHPGSMQKAAPKQHPTKSVPSVVTSRAGFAFVDVGTKFTNAKRSKHV